MDRPRESRSGSDIHSLSESSLRNCAESCNKRGERIVHIMYTRRERGGKRKERIVCNTSALSM